MSVINIHDTPITNFIRETLASHQQWLQPKQKAHSAAAKEANEVL
jgi:hypothetical protein